MTRFGTIALLIMSALLGPATALAGSATGLVSVSLAIPGIASTGPASTVRLDDFLAVKAATGVVSVSRAVGTTMSRPLAAFSLEAAGADTPQLNDRKKGSNQNVTHWDGFRTNFSLTGGKGVATSSGDDSPVPASETYALLAAGLLAIGMMLRRRSQD